MTKSTLTRKIITTAMSKAWNALPTVCGLALLLHSVFDGAHYQMQGLPVQWADVSGISSGLLIICGSMFHQSRDMMRRLKDIEQRLASIQSEQHADETFRE